MRWGLSAMLAVLVAATCCYGIENGFQALTIVHASQKTRDRVLYYLVNTPVYQEQPYFEVEVRVANTLLTGEYEPRSPWEMLPEPWKPGAVIQGRIEKRSMLLRRPNGTDLRFTIIRRSPAGPPGSSHSR